jgi:hypothetical protein
LIKFLQLKLIYFYISYLTLRNPIVFLSYNFDFFTRSIFKKFFHLTLLVVICLTAFHSLLIVNEWIDLTPTLDKQSLFSASLNLNRIDILYNFIFNATMVNLRAFGFCLNSSMSVQQFLPANIWIYFNILVDDPTPVFLMWISIIMNFMYIFYLQRVIIF